jgi:hypothetical protein
MEQIKFPHSQQILDEISLMCFKITTCKGTSEKWDRANELTSDILTSWTDCEYELILQVIRNM